MPRCAAVNTDPRSIFDWTVWLEHYTPLDVDAWPDLREFVLDSARAFFELVPPESRDAASGVVRSIVDIAAFQRSQAGQLTRRSVFARTALNQFDAHRGAALRYQAAAVVKARRPAVLGKGEVTSGSKRSHLVRVGRVLNPAGGWDLEPVPHPRHVSLPYTWYEEQLLEDSVGRNHGLARVNGEAVLVLGRGAGLTGRELLVRARDCYVGSVGIQIEVNGRVVTILARFEDRLVTLLENTRRDNFLMGSQAIHKNAVNEAVGRVKIAVGAPALQPGRLRNTWIVEHLSAATNVKVLMQAAGLATLTPISDMAAFIPDFLPGDAAAALREGLGAR